MLICWCIFFRLWSRVWTAWPWPALVWWTPHLRKYFWKYQKKIFHWRTAMQVRWSDRSIKAMHLKPWYFIYGSHFMSPSHFSLSDMKDSPGGASAGKPSNLLGGQQCEGAPAAAVIRPEVELSNLMMCSRLSPSQASIQSGSSLGSVRGDEGGLYSDFYGDYCPLFDNGQDPDSASLRGE